MCPECACEYSAIILVMQLCCVTGDLEHASAWAHAEVVPRRSMSRIVC